MRQYLLLIILFCSSFLFSNDFSREIKLTDPRMNGEDVLAVQKALLGLRFYEVEIIDGWFGPKTEAAVKRFQKFYGFVQNGIVNEDVWNALFTKNGIYDQYILYVRSANDLVYGMHTYSTKLTSNNIEQHLKILEYESKWDKSILYCEVDNYLQTEQIHYEIFPSKSHYLIIKIENSNNYPEKVENTVFFSIGDQAYQMLEEKAKDIDFDAQKILRYIFIRKK
jgi:hypothetical protein